MPMETCLFCGVTIRRIHTYDGGMWIHVSPGASETSQYVHCRRTVATPVPVQEETLPIPIQGLQ